MRKRQGVWEVISGQCYSSRPNRPRTVTHPAHEKSPSARGWMPETVAILAGCLTAGCKAP